MSRLTCNGILRLVYEDFTSSEQNRESPDFRSQEVGRYVLCTLHSCKSDRLIAGEIPL